MDIPPGQLQAPTSGHMLLCFPSDPSLLPLDRGYHSLGGGEGGRWRAGGGVGGLTASSLSAQVEFRKG